MTGNQSRGRGPFPEEPAEPPSRRRRSGAGRLCVVAVVLTGAGFTVWLLAHYGWRPVALALSRVGMGGLAIFCGYTLFVFLLLGWCWFLVAPRMSYSRLPAFVFGRLLREAAADVLPFSQVGGFVLGARGASLLGVPSAIAVASCVIDMGAEMLGQLMFTVTGLVILVGRTPAGLRHNLAGSGAWTGVVVLGVLLGLLTGVRWPALRLLRWAGSRLPEAVRGHLTDVREEFRRLGRRPIRLLASAGFHFAAWLMAAAGVWLMLKLFGVPMSLASVIAMEGMVYLLRSLAFVVPGAIGVLEGGYVLMGPVFGLPSDVALSLSLLKRARDLALGLPVVLVWQLLEGRRMMSGATAVTTACSLDAGASSFSPNP